MMTKAALLVHRGHRENVEVGCLYSKEGLFFLFVRSAQKQHDTNTRLAAVLHSSQNTYHNPSHVFDFFEFLALLFAAILENDGGGANYSKKFRTCVSFGVDFLHRLLAVWRGSTYRKRIFFVFFFVFFVFNVVQGIFCAACKQASKAKRAPLQGAKCSF
jgi:hypothetical protein